jgi:uncharacterized protein YjbJ (UPF0337 family)
MNVNRYQPNQETVMNWDVIEGNWKQAKGKVKQQWGRLTDDDLEVVSGKRDQLVGQIQECYGIAKDEAERQVSDWEAHHAELFDAAMRPLRKKHRASRH